MISIDKKEGNGRMGALFQNVDCVSFYVDNLEEGIKFYSTSLGLKLLWRAKSSCGLGMEEGITEVVLVNEHNPMVDFKVECVQKAIETFVNAGGTLICGPFDIDIGKCAVVEDQWQNRFCILDMSKGIYQVDEDANVIGVN